MTAGIETLETDFYPGLESRGVLPDPTVRTGLHWCQVKALVPRAEKLEVVDQNKVDVLLAERNKKEFSTLSEQIWPPRSKTDLSLRRSRLLDYVIHARRVRSLDVVRRVFAVSKQGWDLIFVTNLCVAVLVLGTEWFERWEWLGAFDADLTHYIAVTKKVHDIGKSTGLVDPNWRNYVECSVLSGYRNLPFPGFDVVEEAKALAEGGDEHTLFGFTWDALCVKFLPMSHRRVKYIPFREWVAECSWLTTGASSVGYLELVTPDGKTHRVKARKNMVADIYDLGELADESLASVESVNVAIIKSELGKLRVAVAGDIYTYLKMTWINDLLGGAYYDWPGNTSEEDFEQQTVRLAKMLELCAKRFGLPYDYAGFDHQPQTTELKGIVRVLCRHARLNVPAEAYPEFDSIVENVVGSFDRSVLVVRDGDRTEKFKVTGGLMSGLRWTSVVGNAWNSVMTGLAMELLTMWGISTDEVERFIRGDDSAIFVPNWATGAAMNLAYDAIGAKAGAGKFSLQNHQMEFLRVWFDTRCNGYPVRAIPGLTQRKPWTSNPWSEDMVLKALWDTVKTLKRRVVGREKEIESIWVSLRQIWCMNHRLPNLVTSVPIFAGGFGLEPAPVGVELRLSPPVPRASVEGLSVANQNGWRANNLLSYARERYGLEIGDRASEIAREELVRTIASDNVPDVARVVRNGWLSAVRSAGCRVVSTSHPLPVYSEIVNLQVYDPSRVRDLMNALKGQAPLFGSCPEIQVARSDYAKFRPDMTFSQWLHLHFPKAKRLLNSFHRSWHRSEALDYLEGKLTLAPRVLHPALVKVLAWQVAAKINPAKKVNRYETVWGGSVCENRLALSPISQLTYWW